MKTTLMILAVVATCAVLVGFLAGPGQATVLPQDQAAQIRGGVTIDNWCGYWYAGVDCKNINGNGQFPNCTPTSADPCDECSQTYAGSACKLWDGLKCIYDSLSCGKRLVGQCSGGSCTNTVEQGNCPNPMQITLINCPS